MLGGEVDARAAATPDELRASYEAALAETIESVGIEAVAERSGVSRETLEALLDGNAPELTVEEAAAILAADEGRPEPAAIAAEARDALLMGMTTAVIDVEALASELDAGLDPKELQQKIEGRHPMTLAEFAAVEHHLAGKTQ